MAVYKLIPSSFTKSSSLSTLSNASNAYTDTDSKTKAQLTLKYGNTRGWLGGFNFPTLESGERIVSITAKVKTYNTILNYGEMRIVSDATTSNVVLSSSINSDDCGAYPAEVYTMEWVEDLDTVYSYRDTFCIEFKQNTSYSSGAFMIYGAEIIVETAKIERNKIIYGGETLIDLTSDTVTAADVTSGVVFHLPSGVQSIGTLVASMKKATMSTPSNATTMKFTVDNEPSSFIVVCTARSSDTSSALYSVVYDGSKTYTYYGTSSVGVVRSGTSAATFTYSNKILTITSSRATIRDGTYDLYYL